MVRIELQVGDVVQIAPSHDDVFGGSLMVVTEPKGWGAQGYVNIPGRGLAYYRCAWEHMELVGRAPWVMDRGDCIEAARPQEK
jgi:hypothetical protein